MVVWAAVKFINKDKSTILKSTRHAECYEEAYKSHLIYEKAIDGFITDTNEFVDRYEAKKIAVSSNQLIVPVEDTLAALYSEDVW